MYKPNKSKLFGCVSFGVSSENWFDVITEHIRLHRFVQTDYKWKEDTEVVFLFSLICGLKEALSSGCVWFS